MGIRTEELKSDTDERRFIFYVSANYQVLHWENLFINKSDAERYFERNLLPEDKYFSKSNFLNDLSCEGFVCITCENEETAEYIADLFSALL